MIGKSFAGSETKYVILQARVTKNENLHIQGYGTNKVNRSYGMSATIENSNFDNELMDYLKTIKGDYQSLQGTVKTYFPIQATFYNNGIDIHFQIKYHEKFGKDYGTSFSIPTVNLPSALIKFIKLDLYGS